MTNIDFIITVFYIQNKNGMSNKHIYIYIFKILLFIDRKGETQNAIADPIIEQDGYNISFRPVEKKAARSFIQFTKNSKIS